jgi:hypothetical protein
MEVTASARADEVRVRIMAVSVNGFERAVHRAKQNLAQNRCHGCGGGSRQSATPRTASFLAKGFLSTESKLAGKGESLDSGSNNDDMDLPKLTVNAPASSTNIDPTGRPKNATQDILAEILEWSTLRPGWQRDALRQSIHCRKAIGGGFRRTD